MTTGKQFVSTPTAILIGSIIVALGLFFGLRSGGGQAPSAPLAASSSLVQPGARVPPDRSVRPRDGVEDPTPITPRDAVTQQAQAALDGQRDKLVQKCMRALPRPDGAPDEVRLTFNVTFAADGSQLARGVSEERKHSRPEVTRCVTETLEPLRIPAPGVVTQVDIALTLP